MTNKNGRTKRHKIVVCLGLLLVLVLFGMLVQAIVLRTRHYEAAIQTDPQVTNKLIGTWTRDNSGTQLVLRGDGTGYFRSPSGVSQIDWSCSDSEFSFVEYGDPRILNLSKMRRIALMDTSMSKTAQITQLDGQRMEFSLPDESAAAFGYTRSQPYG